MKGQLVWGTYSQRRWTVAVPVEGYWLIGTGPTFDAAIANAFGTDQPPS